MAQGGVIVIKKGRTRRSELFSIDKLRNSIVATCASINTPQGQAESIADSVASDVQKWLENRPEITSNDIRQIVGEKLSIYHPEAGYLYKQHNLTM